MRIAKFFIACLTCLICMAMSNSVDAQTQNDDSGPLFHVKNDGNYGYIDKTGKMVVNPQLDCAEDFSEGLAAVHIGDLETGKCGYIDKTGKMVIDPQFDWAWSSFEGLAAVRIGDRETGKWDYIDKTGKYAINPQFDFALSFSAN